MKPAILAVLAVLSLAACREETAAVVAPVTLSEEAIGRYCGMNLAEHEGPKGQVILTAGQDPFWFSSARDTVAFTMMPDEPKDFAAIYVTDMAKAPSWADPGSDNWVDARQAFYVSGSTAAGGMGGAELVPFSTREAAQAFAAQKGGSVQQFAELTPQEVLANGTAPIEETPHADH